MDCFAGAPPAFVGGAECLAAGGGDAPVFVLVAFFTAAFETALAVAFDADAALGEGCCGVGGETFDACFAGETFSAAAFLLAGAVRAGGAIS